MSQAWQSPASIGRRTFLGLATAAAGAWASRAGPALAGGGRPGGAPSATGDHALVLRVPPLTGNGERVPIVLESPHPMTRAHHVTRVRVSNEADPVATKGTFQFTPANGRVYLSFQARMHEGRSTVTATSACTLGRSFEARSLVEIPGGGGG